jgi:outer membrane protein OmpA-like peptidoglycan-associated protein
MAEMIREGGTAEAEDEGRDTNQEDLSELRSLLFSPEQAKISSLQKRLDDPKLYAEDVSRALPDAIALRSSRDHRLTKALMPSIEAGITASVRKNPETLANAIFPVIGPAIRKTISQILRQMVQSLNQTLEHSLSIKGLNWRIEAIRTGRPFAEVVLSHTLLYSVEQVFLIHKETGLLLQHVARPSVTTQDADLVSGMLTAIQDFVRDSLGGRKGDELESLQVGELTVWIEQGPQAVIAAVIRGNAPAELRATLQDALDQIHLRQREALDSFEGDAAAFEASHDELEGCLRMQLETKRKKASPMIWVALALVAVALGVWLFFSIRDGYRWNSYVNALKSEPGIVVVSEEKRGGKYLITGLRDPMAIDPSTKFEATNVAPENVISRWEPYQSAHPEFALARAKSLLQPPETVRLRIEDGALVAEGTAPHAWIVEARRLAQMIPGIAAFREESLVDADGAGNRIEAIRQQIEQSAITFDTGSANLSPDLDSALRKIASDIQSLGDLSRQVGKAVRVEISGYTDQSGTEEANQRLRQQRAETVRAALISRGVKPDEVIPTGAQLRRTIERKVIFKVTTIDAR